MPNIEIYGCDSTAYGRAKGDNYRREVWKALRGIPDLEEIVVTVVPSEVQDHTQTSVPYLRLLYTPETTPTELAEIERRLDKVDLDLEVELLVKFRERRSVRAKKLEATVQSVRDQIGLTPTPSRDMCD